MSKIVPMSEQERSFMIGFIDLMSSLAQAHPTVNINRQLASAAKALGHLIEKGYPEDQKWKAVQFVTDNVNLGLKEAKLAKQYDCPYGAN